MNAFPIAPNGFTKGNSGLFGGCFSRIQQILTP